MLTPAMGLMATVLLGIGDSGAGGINDVRAHTCFLVCFIPFPANLLESDPKPETPEALADQTRPYVSFRFSHSA